MYRIELSHQVQKFLDRFDEKFVKNFYDKIELLRINPFARNISIDIKPITCPPNFPSTDGLMRQAGRSDLPLSIKNSGL
ncbi:MAG: hypothetical protein KJ666_15210 [Bacteroidetes bacterium]|nr:hypothetical protein [Bacteroidota bacterium]